MLRMGSVEVKEHLKIKISGAKLKFLLQPFCTNAELGWHHEKIEKQRLQK
jgi:hypothetical protein